MTRRKFQLPIIERFIEEKVIREGSMSKTMYCVVLCKDGKTYAFFEHVAHRENITGAGGFGFFDLGNEEHKKDHDLIVWADYLWGDWRTIDAMSKEAWEASGG